MVAHDDFSTRVRNWVARQVWVVGCGYSVYRALRAIPPTALVKREYKIHVKMGYMPRKVFAVLLGATIVFVSCSQPGIMQRPANVVTPPLKDRVPPPDPAKYLSVRDASDWQNPYLTVDANGIQVRQNGVAREAPTMSPDDAVAFLEKLPAIAWPYGLIVVVQENGLRNPGDEIPIETNREALVHLLEKAGIKASLWPA